MCTQYYTKFGGCGHEVDGKFVDCGNPNCSEEKRVEQYYTNSICSECERS